MSPVVFDSKPTPTPRGGARPKRASTVAAALASLCETCGGRILGGAVTAGDLRYCTFECALAASGPAVPGNYLG
jgi:hypothetical protein